MEPSFKIRNNKNTKKRAAEIDAGAEYAAKDGDESKDSALAGTGEANHAIAQKIGVNRKTVILWRGRFRKNGIVGLKDGTRPGRKPKIARHGAACYRYDASEETACGNTLEQSNTWEGVEYF